MAKIYRTTDRIPLKVGELTVIISPLSNHQKASVEAAVDGTSAGFFKAAMRAISYAVKDVKGVEDMDGRPYELSFNENGELTDETLDDLFNLEESDKLSAIALSLINNIPSQFMDAVTGEPLKGVEFIVDKEEKAPRKKKRASVR